MHTLEQIGRYDNKHIVLDCPTEMAKQILIQHVRDLRLGRRTYHYLLSGLVSVTVPPPAQPHLPPNSKS
ncbi:hypothetical protein KR067_012196 [Drosophila pandora]|nr:hypothetical protein KR067_012196 [Drosophila pandora]